MEYEKEVCKNLKLLRLQAQKTQLEVSEAISKSLSAYQSYERGKSTPDIDSLKKLADLYNVSLDHICGRDEIQDSEYTATPQVNEILTQISKIDPEKWEKIAECVTKLQNSKKI